jgi:hypothetical protein
MAVKRNYIQAGTGKPYGIFKQLLGKACVLQRNAYQAKHSFLLTTKRYVRQPGFFFPEDQPCLEYDWTFLNSHFSSLTSL